MVASSERQEHGTGWVGDTRRSSQEVDGPGGAFSHRAAGRQQGHSAEEAVAPLLQKSVPGSRVRKAGWQGS